MNPYEADPNSLPADDPYLARSVHYGRYAPRQDDFRPRDDRWCQSDPESISYWEDIVKKFCVPENSLNSVPETREAFAVGSVAIRIDRDNDNEDVVSSDIYAHLNANESLAARKAEDALRTTEVAVPVIYFCGNVGGKNVVVESRIPGVSLDVAWRYLNAEQIERLKMQCRHILLRLAATGASENGPSYVCRELNANPPSATQAREREILLGPSGEKEQFCFTHNDMIRSNIIVRDDQVVGLLGWRQSGFFGLERAAMVHRQFRIPEPAFISGSQEEKSCSWDDLYDDLHKERESQDVLDPRVKAEPSSISLEKLPFDSRTESPRPSINQLDGTDTPEDHPTTKKITGLKQDEKSRGSSSERSSPVTSTEPTTTKKKAASASATKKKGTTSKKTAVNKRKRADNDGDSADGRRSNTPVSSQHSKTPAARKQSTTDSPAPDGKKKESSKVAAAEEDNVEEDDVSDPNETFCICRKPDNHTWMIACDGGCEDWFHGKCVNIDSRDADLIDRYICPNCNEQGKGRTSWKPMCRLPSCRKPARVTRKDPSKYCCDDHGREFMRRKTQHFNIGVNSAPRKSTAANRSVRATKDRLGDRNSVDGDPDDSHVDEGPESNFGDVDSLDGGPNGKPPTDELGSRGGVLTAGELKAAIMGVSSASEFRRLGERIISPPPDDAIETKQGKANIKNETKDNNNNNNNNNNKPTGKKKLGLDIDPQDLTYTPDEASKLEKLRKTRNDYLHRQGMLDARGTFLTIVRQRAKHVLDRLKQTDPKGGWKDICGFDSRLAWSDEEFDEWRLSPVGEKTLKDGTPDAVAASFPEHAASNTDADGDVAMDGNAGEANNSDNFSRGVCTKKRCERHKQWVKVQQQDIQFEESVLQQSLVKCEQEAQTVVERAVLRMWAKTDNALSGGD